MNATADLLSAFGQALGLADFRWPADGLAAFAFDQRGLLSLEVIDQTLLVYLSRDCDLRSDARTPLAAALRLCHYRQRWPFTVQCALREESQLVFLIRLPLATVTLPELEQALDLLTRLHEQVAAA